MESSKIEEIQNYLNINSSSFLKNFPQIQFDQTIHGFYELNGQILYGHSPDFDKNIATKHELPAYESINDVMNETTNLLLNPQTTLTYTERQPFFRKLLNTYLNSGFVGLLEELRNRQKPVKHINEYVIKGSEMILKLVDFIYAPIIPWFLSGNEEEFTIETIKGESWSKSLIKEFKWHPNFNKYAIAFKNDIVKVYSPNHPPVILKHPKQIEVTCIAWKPYYSSIIAIGCANCIIIWDTDNLPVSIKPSSSCSFFISKRYHQDITDLQWYPKSDFLVSVASKDNQIMVWDITQKLCVPVKRIGTVGFSLCKFSINSNKLFTADLATTFRIWRPDNYTSEKWTNLIARCKSACWSPDGSILLFSCHGCPLIYSLKFLNNNNQDLKIVCDLSSVIVFKTEDSETSDESIMQKYSIGGAIDLMEWDTSGQRLAVTFRKYDNVMNVNVVAVFITKFLPELHLLPCVSRIVEPCEDKPLVADESPTFMLVCVGRPPRPVMFIRFKADILQYNTIFIYKWNTLRLINQLINFGNDHKN